MSLGHVKSIKTCLLPRLVALCNTSSLPVVTSVICTFTMRFATASLILAYVAAVAVHALPAASSNAVEQRSTAVAGALVARVKEGLKVRAAKKFVTHLLVLAWNDI